MAKDLYDIGEIPPLGEVPRRMLAQLIRPERFGEPEKAFQIEEVTIPELGPHDALVLVMAAGINYNNVWAARGTPVDVIAMRQKAGEPYDFHIGGSDCSGIVYAVGSEVEGIEVGDEVITHPGYWDAADPWIQAGKDPMIAPSARIWGYDTNFGSDLDPAVVADFNKFTYAEITRDRRRQLHLLGARPWGIAQHRAPVYIGDDDTDEDAFASAGPERLLSIRVGTKRPSKAQYRLKRQLDMDHLLKVLIELRKRPN